jgi:hypothetical protein
MGEEQRTYRKLKISRVTARFHATRTYQAHVVQADTIGGPLTNTDAQPCSNVAPLRREVEEHS